MARNWVEAQIACMEINSTLASITNMEELQSIQTNCSFIGRFFIGGTDSGSENEWKWSDGAEWEFENWRSGEPNGGGRENCLEMEASGLGLWNDIDCSGFASRCNMVGHVGPIENKRQRRSNQVPTRHSPPPSLSPGKLTHGRSQCPYCTRKICNLTSMFSHILSQHQQEYYRNIITNKTEVLKTYEIVKSMNLTGIQKQSCIMATLEMKKVQAGSSLDKTQKDTRKDKKGRNKRNQKN